LGLAGHFSLQDPKVVAVLSNVKRYSRGLRYIFSLHVYGRLKPYPQSVDARRCGMRFYLHKIGGHLQELAVLALVFVPLDSHLTHKGIAVLCASCVFTMVVGIEMERRTR
jgi:hypothetical protein